MDLAVEEDGYPHGLIKGLVREEDDRTMANRQASQLARMATLITDYE
jgi:hypothetical protein